jgi:glutathione S-transferase
LFLQLPYLIDGEHKITQSNAIMRYMGRKHGLDGKTEEEKVRVDMLENESMDFRNGLISVCYNPDFVSTHLTRLSIPSGLNSKTEFRPICGMTI